MAIIEPAQVNYFGVLLWDMQGFGAEGQVANVVAGVVANLANVVLGGFSEVRNLDVGMATEDYEEGGNDYSPLHFHKAGEYEDLVLKRGTTSRTDLWDWHQQVMRGKETVIRRSGLIILFDRNGASLGPPDAAGVKESIESWLRVPIAAWYVHRALPLKVSGPELNADAEGSEAIAYEEVHLRHEGVWRVSLSTSVLTDFASAEGVTGSLLGGWSAAAGALDV